MFDFSKESVTFTEAFSYCNSLATGMFCEKEITKRHFAYGQDGTRRMITFLFQDEPNLRLELDEYSQNGNCKVRILRKISGHWIAKGVHSFDAKTGKVDYDAIVYADCF
jgi:hypothetical protein